MGTFEYSCINSASITSFCIHFQCFIFTEQCGFLDYVRLQYLDDTDFSGKKIAS